MAEKRCGKRKNPQFPFTNGELKEKLLDNMDRIKDSKITKTDIRTMSRKDLCKYFATKNSEKLKFNLKLVNKKGQVVLSKEKAKGKSKSKSPAKKSRSRSKSPLTKGLKKKSKSKSPAKKRKSKSKSPAKKRKTSKSPAKKRSSKSPKKAKKAQKKTKKPKFVEKDGLFFNEKENFFAILNKKMKYPKLGSLKEGNIAGEKSLVIEKDFLPFFFLIQVNDEDPFQWDEVNFTAFAEPREKQIFVGDIVEEIVRDKKYFQQSIEDATTENGYTINPKTITIKGFRFGKDDQGVIARVLVQVKGSKVSK